MKATVTTNKEPELHAFRAGDIIQSKTTGNIYLVCRDANNQKELLLCALAARYGGQLYEFRLLEPQRFTLFKGTITLENDK